MISLCAADDLHTIDLDTVTRNTLLEMLGGLDAPGPFEQFLLHTLQRTQSVSLDPPNARQMWFLLWLLTDRSYRGLESAWGSLWDHPPAHKALESLDAFQPASA